MFLRYFIVFAIAAIISSVSAALRSPHATILSSATAPRLAAGDQSERRFVRAIDTTDASDEERAGPSASAVEKAKILLVNDVFKKLGVKGKLFDSPQFVAWLRYADDFAKKNPVHPNVRIRTLVRHYDDDQLLDMIELATKNPSTVKVAKRLQKEYGKWSLQAQRLPDDAFYSMVISRAARTDKYLAVRSSKISKVTENLLASDHFQLWRKYLDRFNAMYPKQKASVIDTLLAYYTDEALAQMLRLAKKNPSTEKVAANLQLALLNTWVRELKDPSEVSKLLKVGTSDALMQAYTRKYNWAVNNAGDKLFDKPQIETWLKYVDFFKAKHPGTQESTTAILTARYGDEAVAKMILELKSKPDKVNLAKEMETAQLQGWLSSQTSLHVVFELLNLKGVGDDLLSNPLFNVWFTYRALVGGSNRRERTTLFEALMKEFDDEALAKIIIVGKRYPSTSQKAESLQKHQLAKWLKEKQAPNTVCKWLGVKGTAADSVERRVYLNYRKDFKAKYLKV